MPPKKPHKKSRFGCDHCKKRRVKCDEKKPRCTNCITRNEECHFERRSIFQHAFSSNPASPVSQIAGTDMDHGLLRTGTTTDTSFWPSVRFRELELMHHWCTRSCYSFTAPFADIFRGYVVEEALKHEYLMDSILGLTSLHLASEMNDPMAASPYVRAALSYQNKAVSALRSSLQDVTRSNCDAIFLSSMVTMASTIVSPLLPTRQNDQTKSPTESILFWFNSLKGVRSIVDISRQWLVSGPLAQVLAAQQQNVLGKEKIGPIERLRYLNDTFVGTGNDSHEIYELAIGQLEKCSNKELSAVPWLARVELEFMNKFRERKPMAVTIFMHWAVLLDQLDDMWWTKYSGKRLVEESSASLAGCGREWDEIAQWCQSQVGL
ncbi:hypothetical protein K469DRAFT_596866 [Zopfia rhizophila CBS 207.26]|uniref:Zn(2)-C6 fungal-type domain-containing protein n=1 Tax=Zopfia rhizophila CBS 207.26 TaxID=1314779 RepID=A0A6A6DK10_9PEZI|nr:hypothetical protein K469DRAFT_596866 [Zopfia rhizophila CBS 207.26]